MITAHDQASRCFLMLSKSVSIICILPPLKLTSERVSGLPRLPQPARHQQERVPAC